MKDVMSGLVHARCQEVELRSTDSREPALSLSKGRLPHIGALRADLAVKGSGAVMFRNYALGVIGQSFGLGKKIQAFQHFGIRFRANLQAFILAESIHENLRLDVGPDPVVVIDEIRLGIGNAGLVERLAEILHGGVVDFKILRGMMIDDVSLGEVEKRVVLQQRVLKVIALDGRDLNIRLDAAATIDSSSAIGELDLAVDAVAGLTL